MTVRDMLTEVVERRRQDLNYLKTVVEGTDRYYLPSLPERGVGERALKEELKALGEPVYVSPSPDLDLSFLHKAPKSVPVSGLMLGGVPVHPPGVHQQQGFSSTNRIFGGSKWDKEWLRRVLTIVQPAELEPSLRRFVYTRGTAQGFEKRLHGLASRAPPQITKSLGINDKQVLGRIQRLFPLKDGSWPTTWHQDLSEQFEAIKTSKNSSAGAPYWREKKDAAAVCLDVVLPLLHKAIAEGKVAELCKQQPELFLGEVKNKLDRYEPEKLADKTRPYFALPFHWQALFSMLSQPFTEMLETFDQGCGANAYGFSHAHGGAARLVAWARECVDLEKGGSPRFACYGDDVDLYWRTGGILYRVTPDFRQMDASVDKTTIRLAVLFVYETLAKRWGPNPFFEQVAEWWVRYATNPWFLVHGDGVYKKKTPDGLMTGVVGTTFFDTVKSALAYDEWTTQVATYKDRKLLEEKFAVPWFRDKFGLDVKVGTWKPEPVLEAPTPGELWAESKFLGIRLQYRQGPNRVEPVPSLDYTEWLDLLLSPRDDPSRKLKSGGGSSSDSFLGRSRTWFDRLRGYTATGAAFDERTRHLIGSLANGIDPVAVVMSVQAGKGTGAVPEMAGPLGEPEQLWPDSSGFPSLRWTENLYFTEDNQWDDPLDDLWIDLFPGAKQALSTFKADNMIPKMSVAEVWMGKPEAKASVPILSQQVVEYVEETREGPEKVVERMDPIDAPKETIALPLKKASERSPILDYQDEGPPKPAKRLPTFGVTLHNMFLTRKAPIPQPRVVGTELRRTPEWEAMVEWLAYNQLSHDHLYSTPVLSVRRVAEAFGRTHESVEAEARKVGLYVIGKSYKMLTKVPLETANPVLAAQFTKQKAQNVEKAKVVSPNTGQVLKVLAHKIPAAGRPIRVKRIGPDPHLPIPGRFLKDDAMSSLNSLLQLNGWIPQLQNRNVRVDKMQKTCTRLYLKRQKPEEGYSDYPWLEVVGDSSRKNYSDLLEYALRTGAHVEEPKGTPWADIVEKEERARFESSSGLVFLVKDKFLVPGPDLPTRSTVWTVDKGFINMRGVIWKQRKTETLVAFCERTEKFLESCGVKVSWSAPKSQRPEFANY